MDGGEKRIGEGEHTRVELSTVDRRGKSLIPWSRIEMEESRSWREDLRDWTEAEREDAELVVDIVAVRFPRLGNTVIDAAVRAKSERARDRKSVV